MMLPSAQDGSDGFRSQLPNPAVTDTWAVLHGRNNETGSHDLSAHRRAENLQHPTLQDKKKKTAFVIWALILC